MSAQHLEDGLAEKLTGCIIQILWDEKPRTTKEIARELQMNFPLQFFEMDTDLLAKNVYSLIIDPLLQERFMTAHEGRRYSISVLNKERRRRKDESP